jgi:hypothetical protein
LMASTLAPGRDNMKQLGRVGKGDCSIRISPIVMAGLVPAILVLFPPWML